MGDLHAIQKFLTRDPVMQALFEAEATARSRLQLQLLDAVATDDVRTVRQLLDEEDHGDLLEDAFFLPLSILMVGKSVPAILEAFSSHGYTEATRPAQRGLSSELTMGTIALWTCPPERQKQLFDIGFLSVHRHAHQGMRSVDPAVFDLWSDLYLADQKRNEHTVPQATNALFRWVPYTSRKQASLESSATRSELTRRLDKLVEGFLALHYPSTTLQQRWQRFVENPPTTSAHAASALEAASFMKILVDHQFKACPELRTQRVDLALENRQASVRYAHLAHALLRSGFTLDDFEGDLVERVLSAAHQCLQRNENPPEGLNTLWIEVASRLREHDPARYQALPADIAGDVPNLQVLTRFDTVEEKNAFCQLLELHLQNPQVKSPSLRPRL